MTNRNMMLFFLVCYICAFPHLINFHTIYIWLCVLNYFTCRDIIILSFLEAWRWLKELLPSGVVRSEF